MPDPQITLDGVTLDPYDDGTLWRSVEEITGWYDSPKPRTGYTSRPFAPGSYFGPAWQDVRTVTLTGRVAATDDATFVDARRQLNAMCLDPFALSELQVDDAAGSLFTLVQRSSEVLFKPIGARAADWSMSLTAPDPRLLGVALQSVSTPMAQSGTGGVAWNGPTSTVSGVAWNGPSTPATGVQWGSPVSTGIVTVDNLAGTAPADVIVTIHGPVEGPSIGAAGGWITYDGNLAANDVLTINTGTGEVTLNGAGRRAYLTRADWFTVPPGQTMGIRFVGAVQSDAAALTASWRTTYT
jgi:hypothetical protein